MNSSSSSWVKCHKRSLLGSTKVPKEQVPIGFGSPAHERLIACQDGVWASRASSIVGLSPRKSAATHIAGSVHP